MTPPSTEGNRFLWKQGLVTEIRRKAESGEKCLWSKSAPFYHLGGFFFFFFLQVRKWQDIRSYTRRLKRLRKDSAVVICGKLGSGIRGLWKDSTWGIPSPGDREMPTHSSFQWLWMIWDWSLKFAVLLLEMFLVNYIHLDSLTNSDIGNRGLFCVPRFALSEHWNLDWFI